MWTLRKKNYLRAVESGLLSNRRAARNFSFNQLRHAIVPRIDSSTCKYQPLTIFQYPVVCQKRFLSTVEEDNELTQPPPADDASRMLHYQTYYQESEFDSHARKSLQHASDNGDWIADAYLGILHGLDQNNKTGKEKADKIGQSVVPKLLNFLEEERKLEKSTTTSKDSTQELDFHSPVVAQACYMLAVYHEMAWGVPRNLPLAIDFYLEAAHRKHKLAQYSLAELARTGEYHRTNPGDPLKSASSKPDMDLAMLWYSRAAAQNYAPAQNQMGQLLLQYGFASHMLQDTQQLHALITQVEQYYKDAAFQGHGPAQFNLGNLYAQPHFLVPHTSAHSAPSSSSTTRNDMVENPIYNPSEALRWYVMSADQGYTLAQTMVGICYAQGALGAVQNLETGATWLRRAAKEQDLTAAFHLGTLLYDMFQQEKTREQESVGKSPSTMVNKAETKRSFRLPPEEKLKESVHWLRVAAEAGHIDAQMTLAQYLQQQMIPMQYWTEAERQQGGWYLWYETAANKVQHPEALYQLALAYQTPEMSRMATIIAQKYLDRTKQTSDSSTTSPTTTTTPGSTTNNASLNKTNKEADKRLLSTNAKEFLRHAAEQGHVGAQARLGACLYHGQYGIAQNLSEAVPYLEAASAQEDAASMTLLGLTYLLGQGGVPENVEEGKKWIYLAAEMGYPLAKELVEEANSLSD